jgi:hypothetical protein
MSWSWKRFFAHSITFGTLFYFVFLPAKGVIGWDRLELTLYIGIAVGTASASVKTN